MSKHTPGPWVLNALDDALKYYLPRWPILFVYATVNAFVGTAPSTVCTIENYEEVDCEIDRVADARLIAAAPDMLAALQRLTLAAQHRENVMGEPISLLNAKAELATAAKQADEVIANAVGSET